MRASTLKWCTIFALIIIINVNLTIYLTRIFHQDDIEQTTAITTKSTAKKEYAQANVRGAQILPASVPLEVQNPMLIAPELQEQSFEKFSIPIIEQVDQPVYKDGARDTLPSFTADGIDYIFSSIIERSFDPHKLFVTTFFMSHHLMDPNIPKGLGIEKVEPKMRDKWRKLSDMAQNNSVTYESSGKRSTNFDIYSCKIANADGDYVYVVLGHFLPNRMTSDKNSNRRLDVFRCPIQDAFNASNTLKYSRHEIHVEIFRNEFSLMHFSIPWKTRRTGFLLNQPINASNLDAWVTSRSLTSRPSVHLCMPGTRLLPTRKHLPIFIEFVSHHLLIGFDHVYFPVPYSWDSIRMRILLTIFKSYIDEGKVTIVTQAGDNIDLMVSTHGLEWTRLSAKVFQSNMILFLTKGMADYLAIFDVDELLIPRREHRSIQDIFRVVGHNVLVPRENSSFKGPGFADHCIHTATYW